MLSGRLRVKWGDHLEQELLLEPGDLVYVPPRETHVLENVRTPSPPSTSSRATRPHEDAVIVPWAEQGARSSAGRQSDRRRRARMFRRGWLHDEPTAPPAAVVVLVHGAGEHAGRYEHVAERLVGDGYAVPRP